MAIGFSGFSKRKIIFVELAERAAKIIG